MTTYVFTSNQNWTVPAGINTLTMVEGIDGGTSGGIQTGHADPDDGTLLVDAEGVGGAGATYGRLVNIAVTPGEVLAVAIGTGGLHSGNFFNTPADSLATHAGTATTLKRGASTIFTPVSGTSTHVGGNGSGNGSAPGVGGGAGGPSSAGSGSIKGSGTFADGVPYQGNGDSLYGGGGSDNNDGKNGVLVITATPGGSKNSASFFM